MLLAPKGTPLGMTWTAAPEGRGRAGGLGPVLDDRSGEPSSVVACAQVRQSRAGPLKITVKCVERHGAGADVEEGHIQQPVGNQNPIFRNDVPQEDGRGRVVVNVAKQASDILGRIDRTGRRQRQYGNSSGNQGVPAGCGVVGLFFEHDGTGANVGAPTLPR